MVAIPWDRMPVISEVFSADGPLARALDGFAPRAEQLLMAQAVGEAMAQRTQLVVEAGTGTGKTFAYLIPALLSGGRVVISTGTRTLQDQLFHRDLPLLSRSLGRPVKVALLKGRANYLCRHRLQLARAPVALPGFGRGFEGALAKIERWALQTTSGDISELETVPESEAIWGLVTSTRDNCLGQACPEFRDCHLVAARREAQAAQLVIVNHHLLLADLTLKEEGFGELLPGADAVVLDEAHQFPDIAAQFFGLSFAARAVQALTRDGLAELSRAGLLDASGRAELARLDEAVALPTQLLMGLPERIASEDLPAAFAECLADISRALEAVAARLDDENLEIAAVRAVGRRASELALRLDEWQQLSDEEGLRFVENSRGFVLRFTPFEVATRLKAHVLARPCAWIHTSATLAVGTDFTHYTERVGAQEALTLQIASPFDYERNAKLYLPKGLPEPSARGYTAAVLEAALPVIRAAGGRAFLLFTSHRALSEAAQYLAQTRRSDDDFPVLVQGEAPRDALLRRFRELGNAVLLATGSFWEGVDVRGSALSVVVIDKLPFVPPDDPLLKARLEALRREGKNGFMAYQLPQAVLALKQGVGRLIRATDDTGVIVLADPRLRSKGYGRAFIASLPSMPATQDLAEIQRFLQERVVPLPQRTQPS